MYPYYMPKEIAGGRMVSPDIILMVPRPTTRQSGQHNPILAHTPVVNQAGTNARAVIPYPTIGLPLPNPHKHAAIVLEEFLAISGIGQINMKAQRLIIRRTITHWSYFRSTNEQQMRALGFDKDAACLLCMGFRTVLAANGGHH
jgi:hypothetical protein